MAMTMRRYIDDHGIIDMFRSGYRPNHSTETALVKIFNDISLSLSTGKNVVLCLLDLSAAFDTLKHSVNVYCLPLTTLIRKYGVSYHIHADDT